MIKYIVKNCLNKKRKEKVIHKFIPKYPEFTQILWNWLSWLKVKNKKRKHVIKLLGQFWVSTIPHSPLLSSLLSYIFLLSLYLDWKLGPRCKGDSTL